MNTQQISKQLRFLLEAQNWTGSGNTVFGDVKVSNSVVEGVIKDLRTPFVLLGIGSATPDPEEPDLLTQNIIARLVVASHGDKYGENVMIGGSRTSGLTDSAGKGLLEVEEELFNAIFLLNDLEGIRIQSRAVSIINASETSAKKHVAFRDYSFETWVTADRYYHAPLVFTAVDAAGAGDADLTWTLPPSRYDFNSTSPLGGIIVRVAAGSTAPATPTAGTGVTVGAFATSVTDSPGAGTFSYAVFAGYDETGRTPAVNDNFSEQEAGTTATVVVT